MEEEGRRRERLMRLRFLANSSRLEEKVNFVSAYVRMKMEVLG